MSLTYSIPLISAIKLEKANTNSIYYEFELSYPYGVGHLLGPVQNKLPSLSL